MEYLVIVNKSAKFLVSGDEAAATVFEACKTISDIIGEPVYLHDDDGEVIDSYNT